MMRVLFITSGLGMGGAETALANMLAHLDRTRFEPHVISLSPLREVAPSIEALGVPVTLLDLRRRPARDFVGLIRLIRRIQPGLVQTWMYHADLIGGLAARIAGVRCVVWGIRNSDLAPSANARGTIAVAHLCAWVSCRLPRAVVSCSHVAIEVHRALGYQCAHMVVIGNGFDLEHFRPDPAVRHEVRAALGLPDDARLVLHVGRFHPQKNHLGLLRSAARVQSLLPGTHFVLVGLGVDARNDVIANAVAQLKLGDWVHLLGLRHDTARLFAAADLTVLASFGEAFPRVLGEAMACGVPCVTTDVGDSAMIVGDTGRSVPPRNDAALANAMIELLTMEPTLRDALGQRARARVVADFDIRAITRRYEDLYVQLIEEMACAA